MQNSFDQKKQSILNGISSTTSDNPDASPKGNIDTYCLPIINLINSSIDMVTTSSCSGRVSIFMEGEKDSLKEHNSVISKGNEGHWLFVTHNVEEIYDWSKFIEFQYQSEKSLAISELKFLRHILYKFEPFILHVKCRNSDTASKLYVAAMDCGFRESGIGSNNNVAIRTSIKLDVPIGYVDDDGKLVSLVSSSYLHFLNQQSDLRFKENFLKMDKLYKRIEQILKIPESMSTERSKETKEERRARKIKEGKARQLELEILRADKKDE